MTGWTDCRRCGAGRGGAACVCGAPSAGPLPTPSALLRRATTQAPPAPGPGPARPAPPLPAPPLPAPAPFDPAPFAGLGPALGRFVSGDWVGAAAAVAAGVTAMFVLAGIALGLVEAGTESTVFTPGQFVVLSAVVVALAAGGSVEVGTGDPDRTAGLAETPLLLTAVGFGLLATVFVVRLRRRGVIGLGGAALQAARVAVVQLGALLAVCGVAQVRAGIGGTGSTRVHATVGTVDTLLSGSGWLALALVVATLWRLPALLPPRARAWRDAAGGPAVGAVVAVGLSCLAELILAGVLLLASGTLDDASAGAVVAVTGGALLALPDLLLLAFGLTLGAPLTLPASSLRGWGGFGSRTSVVLTDVTERVPIAWLLPVAVAAAVVVGGVLAALHAASPHEARRACWRSGVALAMVAAVIAVGTTVSGSGAGFGAGGVLVRLDLALAVLLGLLWGVLGGWVGAVLAPALPGRFIDAVRGHVTKARRSAYLGPAGR